jgi:hypothetical protein
MFNNFLRTSYKAVWNATFIRKLIFCSLIVVSLTQVSVAATAEIDAQKVDPDKGWCGRTMSNRLLYRFGKVVEIGMGVGATAQMSKYFNYQEHPNNLPEIYRIDGGYSNHTCNPQIDDVCRENYLEGLSGSALALASVHTVACVVIACGTCALAYTKRSDLEFYKKKVTKTLIGVGSSVITLGCMIGQVVKNDPDISPKAVISGVAFTCVSLGLSLYDLVF